ncbi:hypothetical protein [Tomitella cavernea]|uniref:hypothetical protein n=1 Tax=Tomitella cavernea TaxID=1387982 RepID=UPI00190590A1|nr:hypothetical protein [Tomitella cavernea]
MGSVPASVDPVLWAIIAVAGVVVTPITIALIRLYRDTREVKDQVSNAHSTNLREEQDARHEEILDRMSSQDRVLGELERRTARIGGEVREDRETFARLRAEDRSEFQRVRDADWSEFLRLRAETHTAIRRADASIAKHHPEDTL